MKFPLAICLMVAASLPAIALAADATAAGATSPAAVSGVVLEVIPVEQYSYLRIKTATGERWAAVSKSAIKVGATATVENAVVMNNFESKTLHKTFPEIAFGNLAGSENGASNPHAEVAHAPDAKPIAVSKATGANARTVAEIITKSAELKDKQVLLHAQVVKFNPDIMGKNWLHLRDGSGTDVAKNNDLLVTSIGRAKVGDVITVTGVVHVDKDFGSGYAYKTLIEDATIQP
jgi:hypothetical protein